MRGVAASNLQHNALAWYWRGWVGWGVGLGEGEELRGWAITIQDYARGRRVRECGRVQVGVERSVGGKVCVREGICESLRNGFVPARRRVPSCMFGLLSPPPQTKATLQQGCREQSVVWCARGDRDGTVSGQGDGYGEGASLPSLNSTHHTRLAHPLLPATALRADGCARRRRRILSRRQGRATSPPSSASWRRG